MRPTCGSSRLGVLVLALLLPVGCQSAAGATPQATAASLTTLIAQPEPSTPAPSPTAAPTSAAAPRAAQSSPTSAPSSPSDAQSSPADAQSPPTDGQPTPTGAGLAGGQSNPTGATASAASDSAVTAQPLADNAPCDDTARPDPLPPRGSPQAQAFFRAFREPLPAAPLFDPSGPRRVGLQAGHWLVNDVPPELHGLQAGTSWGGTQEWQVNLDVAQRTAALLQSSGIQVDVLPSTVPASYRANLFLALHADGDTTGTDRGFKITRPGFSSIPTYDDQLVDDLNQAYGADTGLPRDDEHISLRMTYYYAFNSRRYCHAVAPGVPQAIIEMGYLTNATDRQYLLGDPDRLAQGLADGIQTFLSSLP